jgi:hypothetical protein
MGLLDVLWHLANFFMPALALGALAAGGAKLLWRRELATVRWRRLAGAACAACVVVTLGGLLLLGRDGKMATYACMVVVCALTLWWRGFGPGRR